MNYDDPNMLKEKPIMQVDNKIEDKKITWNPEMGDCRKNNSQNDSQNLRRDQIKYRATIAILISIMILILLGSIAYFTL